MSTFRPKHVFPRGEVTRVTITDGVGVTDAVDTVLKPPPLPPWLKKGGFALLRIYGRWIVEKFLDLVGSLMSRRSAPSR